jgi:hypothetical protein
LVYSNAALVLPVGRSAASLHPVQARERIEMPEYTYVDIVLTL